MATVRLRPGTWKLTEDNTANDKVQVDYNWFDIPRNTSITIDVQNMGLMDDAHVEALRVPPEPRTITGNVGNEEFSEREFNKVKDTEFDWEL